MYVYYFIIVQNKAVIAFIIIINLKYTMSKNVSLHLQMSVLFASGLNNLIHFNFQVPLQTLPCQLNLWIQQ